MNYAIILAGGKGSRMKSSVPKQFMQLCGKPMICHSIEAFEKNSNIDSIIIVTAKDYKDYIKELIQINGYKKVKQITEGGAERYDSVYSGICAIDNITASDYIFIHDGARPCITQNVINKCCEEVKEYTACVAAVPVKDTIKVAGNDNKAVKTPDRSLLWQVQTPQVFRADIIKNAYDKLYEDSDKSTITDDAMVAERYMNMSVRLTMSEYTNIKVTTPEDVSIAEIFINKVEDK